MSSIPIVFSTDHRYVMPTGVVIYSLLSVSPNNRYDIFVLIGDDVTDEDKKKLCTQVEQAAPSLLSQIHFIELKGMFSDAFEVRNITRATYYRLLIPWLIPQYDKIFYSDVDIIFVRDLGALYKMDLGDNYIAGVNYEEYANEEVAPYIKKIGLDPSKYVNAGFLLINSKAMRENNLKNLFQKYAKRNFLYQDQDILNIVCNERIAYLPMTCNCRAIHVARYEKEDCLLIHYTGLKPWKGFTFCWDKWWDMYRKSIFYESDRQYKVSMEIMNVQGWTNEQFEIGSKPLVKAARKVSLKFPGINKFLISCLRKISGK